MSWTEPRVDRVKAMWADGYSASQIAADLGGVTRNAVIGVVHRKGLAKRGRRQNQTDDVTRPIRKRRAPGRTDAQRLSRAKELAAYVAPEPEPEIIEHIIPVHQRRTLLELTEDTCRWPIGHPGSADFYFCGGPPLTGSPYCGYHCAAAFRPPNRTAEDDRIYRAQQARKR